MEKRGSQLIRSIFDTDNFFMKICEKILDLVTVNLIFLFVLSADCHDWHCKS